MCVFFGGGGGRLSGKRSNAADVAARDAVQQSKRMVLATWALVVVTGFLGLATAGLVFYTRELVMTPPTFLNVPVAR
jgi:hypothetical protein